MLDIRIFTILIALVCFGYQLVLSDVEADYCYSVDEHPYLNAGSKTNYYHTHGLIKNTSVPNCEPVQIWMLTRHGTRYPSIIEIEGMMKNLPKLQREIIKNHEKHGSGSLCSKDLENLKSWKIDPNLTEDKAYYLTKQGEEDLKSLGSRFKDYFPKLLQTGSADVPTNRYKFRSTNTERTISSMNHFINGLFGDVSVNNTEVVPIEEDTLLSVYKICKPWKELMNDSSTNAELDAFLTGPEFTNTIHNVSTRLGFADDLPSESVWIMYKACVFQRAWYVDELSPWCAAFTEDSLKVFDYEDDLYEYYHSNFGQNMSAKLGCTTLQDMFDHFTKLENGDSNDEPLGVFYFAHNKGLQLLYTALDFPHDSTPLKASNFEIMRDTRKWRDSQIVPFAANFAAVFYKCDSSNKVRFYVNERPLNYKGCDAGVCDWEYLKKKLGSTASNCNIDFCLQ